MTERSPFRIDHPTTDVERCSHDTLVATASGLYCRDCDREI